MEQINQDFLEAISILKSTYKVPFPDEVLLAIQQAQALLQGTVEPLLAAYNDGLITKKVYTEMREFRGYALAYLEFASRLLVEYPNKACEFGEADQAIHSAVKYLKLALKAENSGNCESESSCGCDSSSSCDSCGSSSSSCSCDSSSSCSSCSSSSSCSSGSSSSCGCDSSSSSSSCGVCN